ncbi:hypothetical protein JKF63_04073 [Porcisia hertigi]|uniref:Transmembrane protein n=1 Tax=Porcisia hertigi TaxID=2761500 RepID=A0A836I2N0_9TRYP|nr:hypothetical protein JKF63_04073 [Porcisia hertigi]
MRTFVRCPMSAVAEFCCGPHRLAARACCPSAVVVELRRTFVGNPSPLPSSSSSSVNVSAAEVAAADAAAPSPHPEASGHTVRGFRRGLPFQWSPSQVNGDNVPSAKEIEAMIPTLQELHAQLPGAREMEEMYIRPGSAMRVNGTTGLGETYSGDAATTVTSSQTTSLFENTTDPLEDLLFGPPKDQSAAATEATPTTASQQRLTSRQHMLLAYRALFWGTTFAFLGFTTTVVTAMYLCGYRSLRDLQQGVRDKMGRDEERLRAMADTAATRSQGAAVDTPLVHYVIDLSQPTVAWQQLQEIWGAIQHKAEEEEEEAGTRQ